MATLSPAAQTATPAGHRRRLWLLIGVIGVLIAAGAVWFISAHWPFSYGNIKAMLEDDLASHVEIASYHRTYFPYPGFVARGLTLRRKTALHLPPLGHAETMRAQARWSDLLMLHKRVREVEITGLHIVVPPLGSQANHANFPAGSLGDFTGPDTAIEMFRVRNSVFEIMQQDGKRLIFPIRELALTHFEKNKAMNYALDMQNAIPSGRVQSVGSFGPLNSKQIGVTPVSGTFDFTHVILHDVGEDIAGVLTGHGRFRGSLEAIQAQADTITPDFSVNRGKPTLVAASVQCTVNGTNGDVVLHTIEAHTGKTSIHAVGAVQGAPKSTNLDIDVKDGRAEDVMRPFISDQVPITGSVWLHSHAYLEPRNHGGGFLHRLHLTGAFEVPAERVTDQKTERSLTDFSHRAEGRKESYDDEHATTDTLSSLKGPAQVQDGVASSKHLTFRIPGAEADVNGTFNFHNRDVHLVGNLRMDTDISHTATGFKAFLLKPLAPFFKKKNAGAVVPIAVTGGPGHYQVNQNISHNR